MPLLLQEIFNFFLPTQNAGMITYMCYVFLLTVDKMLSGTLHVVFIFFSFRNHEMEKEQKHKLGKNNSLLMDHPILRNNQIMF